LNLSNGGLSSSYSMVTTQALGNTSTHTTYYYRKKKDDLRYILHKAKTPKIKKFNLSKSEIRLRFCEYTESGHIIVGGCCHKIYVISPDLKQVV
jgi:hypothetical protein